ncbi:recombinase family protein [Streptomyces chartreusis]|jgi:hypothetical protein|uniref:recombinase family protein n=1 Tax=Streptomyces chartreusis TaxID=1969 RepID=UPI0033F97B2C
MSGLSPSRSPCPCGEFEGHRRGLGFLHGCFCGARRDYLRVSLDREMDGLAVDRQRDDCFRITADRGWTVVGTYIDRSRSAMDKTKRRPDYDGMVASRSRIPARQRPPDAHAHAVVLRPAQGRNRRTYARHRLCPSGPVRAVRPERGSGDCQPGAGPDRPGDAPRGRVIWLRPRTTAASSSPASRSRSRSSCPAGARRTASCRRRPT